MDKKHIAQEREQTLLALEDVESKHIAQAYLNLLDEYESLSDDYDELLEAYKALEKEVDNLLV